MHGLTNSRWTLKHPVQYLREGEEKEWQRARAKT